MPSRSASTIERPRAHGIVPRARQSQTTIAAALVFGFLTGEPTEAVAQAAPRVVPSTAGTIQIEEIVGGLEHPWGLALLPDGRMLVTERPGRLRLVGTDGRLSPAIDGVPDVHHEGQGGLLDVALAPDFERSGTLYLSYAEPGPGGASTAVAKARLDGNRLRDLEVIFRQLPKVSGGNHFGGRIVPVPDGTLFITLGERFKFRPAQDVTNHLGSIVRIRTDGSVPTDNPFARGDKGLGEIWSYGHRNIEAAALRPESGALWVAEMGPRGGDELNRVDVGRNYGWPLVSWGKHYDGKSIPDPPTRPEMAAPQLVWTPVISPSGMSFYAGDEFPAWKGKLLIGGLSARALVVTDLRNGGATETERVEIGQRVRDVRTARDGSVVLLTDEPDGEILRLTAVDRNQAAAR